MAQAPLPNGAGGYQFNDGNVGEALLFVQGAPTALTAGAVATADQLANGLFTFNGTAGNLQLPTVADLEAVISSAKVNSAFNFNVLASGSGSPEIGPATGWTLVGSMTAPWSGTTPRPSGR